uniref:Putative thionin n=1 Tax=Knorringia sibirica TaxID=328376 RepID=Q002B9_9CARY|nr:putative thionin precursor [Knorringia sibirica]
MEGKTVILSVLLLSLVMAQFQVEAKSCCQTTTARNIYNSCRLAGGSRERCASLSGCKHVTGNTCSPGWEKFNAILQGDGDGVAEYCKLGCVSSVCGAMTFLQNSDPAKIVNGAVEECTNACSAFCIKGSIVAPELAQSTV